MTTYECRCDAAAGCTEADGGPGPRFWQTAKECPDQPPVDCELAQNGDPCASVGESCHVEGHCELYDNFCGSDHTWVVEEGWSDAEDC